MDEILKVSKILLKDKGITLSENGFNFHRNNMLPLPGGKSIETTNVEFASKDEYQKNHHKSDTTLYIVDGFFAYLGDSVYGYFDTNAKLYPYHISIPVIKRFDIYYINGIDDIVNEEYYCPLCYNKLNHYESSSVCPLCGSHLDWEKRLSYEVY